MKRESELATISSVQNMCAKLVKIHMYLYTKNTSRYMEIWTDLQHLF
jgi:hypothetical protein